MLPGNSPAQPIASYIRMHIHTPYPYGPIQCALSSSIHTHTISLWSNTVCPILLYTYTHHIPMVQYSVPYAPLYIHTISLWSNTVCPMLLYTYTPYPYGPIQCALCSSIHTHHIPMVQYSVPYAPLYMDTPYPYGPIQCALCSSVHTHTISLWSNTVCPILLYTYTHHIPMVQYSVPYGKHVHVYFR